MKEYRFDPQIQLDFKSRIPLRVQLFEKIRKSVIRSRVMPGTRVISESQMAKEFSINRVTVHLAYQDLISCGLFETKSARSGVRIASGAEEFYKIPFPSIDLVLPFSFEKHIKENNLSSMEYTGGIFDRAAELKYSVNIVALPSPDISGKEIELWLEELLSHSIGIITMGLRSVKGDPVLQALIECERIPHVFLTGVSSLSHISTVTEDVTKGVNEMLAHFRKKGIDSISFFSGKHPHNELFEPSSASRIEKVKKIADKMGFRTVHHILSGEDLFNGEKIAEIYLQEKPSPSRAVFAFNDDFACRFIDGMKKKGYSIPEDVKVAGYDNVALPEYSLSSICHNRFELGRAAVDLIHELYNNPSGKKAGHKKVSTSFIARESTTL